jgi:putative ABC transport system substrate-binding protein
VNRRAFVTGVSSILVARAWSWGEESRESTVPGIEAYADADVATARGVTVFRARVSTPHDVPHALAAIRRNRADALKVASVGAVGAETARILDCAASNRVPTIFTWSEPVKRGGLMSYSPSSQQISSRVAALIDRVLRGARPADLPFEHSTRFDLVINLKTAKALGLTISQSLLLRADEVLE